MQESYATARGGRAGSLNWCNCWRALTM